VNPFDFFRRFILETLRMRPPLGWVGRCPVGSEEQGRCQLIWLAHYPEEDGTVTIRSASAPQPPLRRHRHGTRMTAAEEEG
jgi:hypothetical protein